MGKKTEVTLKGGRGIRSGFSRCRVLQPASWQIQDEGSSGSRVEECRRKQSTAAKRSLITETNCGVLYTIRREIEPICLSRMACRKRVLLGRQTSQEEVQGLLKRLGLRPSEGMTPDDRATERQVKASDSFSNGVPGKEKTGGIWMGTVVWRGKGNLEGPLSDEDCEGRLRRHMEWNAMLTKTRRREKGG